MTDKHLDPFRGGHHCQGCGVEMIEHLGLFGTCKQLQELKSDRTALQRKHEEALDRISKGDSHVKELEKTIKALAALKTPTYKATGG